MVFLKYFGEDTPSATIFPYAAAETVMMRKISKKWVATHNLLKKWCWIGTGSMKKEKPSPTRASLVLLRLCYLGIFCFVLIMILSPVRVWAVQVKVLENDRLSVIFPLGLKKEAAILADSYQDIMDDLKEELGWGLGYKATVILIPDEEIFRKISGSRYAVGLAFPRRKSIAINVVPLISKSYLIKEVFEHELCHLVLHDHIKDEFLPRWLDEGVAQWASGNLGELLLYENQFKAVRLNMSGRLIPLDRLALSFPSDTGSLFLAYQESLSFVNYIVKKFGKKKLVSVLNELGRGENIDEAFSKVLLSPVSEIEKKWMDSLSDGNRWLLWLSHYLYQLLFVLGAVLATIAFVKVKLKKRSMDME